MDEYDQIEAEFLDRHPGYAPSMTPPQMQVFPLSLAQEQAYPLAQTPPPAEPLLTRRVAGVPVWGWGAGAVVVGGIAYYFLTKEKSVAKNTGDAVGGEDLPALPAGWSPSRGKFCDRLKPQLTKLGIGQSTTVYSDADDAKKKLKQVSPLVTLQCKGVKVPIRELDKIAKREGLTAVEHEQGVVGFYPGGGKKGKEWEEYIDALREAGQEV